MPPPSAPTADDDLCRLVYYSRNRIAGASFDIERQIQSILASSRRSNAVCAITGALTFNLGMFAQLQERSRPAVESTFKPIQCAPAMATSTCWRWRRWKRAAPPIGRWRFWAARGRTSRYFARIGLAARFESRRMDSERVSAITRELAEKYAAPSRAG